MNLLDNNKRFYKSRQWRELRLKALERDKYRCQNCGKVGKFEIDHIEPLRAGGEFWNLDNLQTLCRRCHFKKTAAENETRPKKNGKLNQWYEYLNELKAKPQGVTE